MVFQLLSFDYAIMWFDIYFAIFFLFFFWFCFFDSVVFMRFIFSVLRLHSVVLFGWFWLVQSVVDIMVQMSIHVWIEWNESTKSIQNGLLLSIENWVSSVKLLRSIYLTSNVYNVALLFIHSFSIRFRAAQVVVVVGVMVS